MNLLPPNATVHEIALAEISTRYLMPIDIPKLWNIDLCPVDLLPWLAWALSVDEWQDSWSETVKRAVIKAAYRVHSIKGTPAAIKLALRSIGYPNVEIIEHDMHYYDGVYQYDGAISYGNALMFPLFDVLIDTGSVLLERAEITKILVQIERYKNERSVKRRLRFKGFELIYNGVHHFDGLNEFNGGFF